MLLFLLPTYFGLSVGLVSDGGFISDCVLELDGVLSEDLNCGKAGGFGFWGVS